MDHELSDQFTLRTGIILVPVGQLNIFHDSDLRDFTARPLVNKYIIPTTWMDTGIGGHGEFEIGDAEVTLEGYVINGLDHNNTYSPTKGTRNMRPNFKNDTNQGKALLGVLALFHQLTLNSELVPTKGNTNNHSLHLMLAMRWVNWESKVSMRGMLMATIMTPMDITWKENLMCLR